MSNPNPRDGRPGLGITKSVVLGRRNANSILVAAQVHQTGKASERWDWLSTFQSNLTYGSTDPDIPDVSDLADTEKEAIDRVLKLSGVATTEGGRMRTILGDIARGFEAMKNLGAIGEDEAEGGDDAAPPPDADRVVTCLLGLRDIVGERIDFANAFIAVGGLPVLLGGTAERLMVPRNVRSTCLRVLADLVKMNRPVQYTLLDNGGIRVLATIYFAQFVPGNEEESDGKIRGYVVKIMDEAVCGHPAAERMFCTSPESRKVIESGMGMHNADEALPAPPTELRRRSVAFLGNLLSIPGGAGARLPSDYETRLKDFKPALDYLACSMLAEETEPDWEVRELAIKTLRSILRHGKGKDVVLEMKETIATTGTKRMEQMRALDRKESNASEVEKVDSEQLLWGELSEELENAA